ncbi:hypothetical protein Tco_0710215 [Tanacetum coccineum]
METRGRKKYVTEPAPLARDPRDVETIEREKPRYVNRLFQPRRNDHVVDRDDRYRDDPIRSLGLKIEIPEFTGKVHPDDFIDWLRVEGKSKIETWLKMKKLMKAKFLPENHRQKGFLDYHNLSQQNITVEEVINGVRYKASLVVDKEEHVVDTPHKSPEENQGPKPKQQANMLPARDQLKGNGTSFVREEAEAEPNVWDDESVDINPFGGEKPRYVNRLFQPRHNDHAVDRDDRYHNDPIRSLGLKIEIPEFTSKVHPDDFIDWLSTVERVFDVRDIPDKLKVKLVAIKLRQHASLWWDHVNKR